MLIFSTMFLFLDSTGAFAYFTVQTILSGTGVESRFIRCMEKGDFSHLAFHLIVDLL